MIHFSPAAETILIMGLFLSALLGGILLYGNIHDRKKPR